MKFERNARRDFDRRKPTRRRKNCLFISVEGEATEPAYFSKVFDLFEREIQRQNGGAELGWTLKTISGSKSAPPYRLEALKTQMGKNFDDGDEAWVVCDRDRWERRQLQAIEDWRREEPERRGFALSSPCFEFWLLLHLTGATGTFDTAAKTTAALKRECPRYVKSSVDALKIDLAKIADAVRRAKGKPNDVDALLGGATGSNVFALVESVADKTGVDLAAEGERRSRQASSSE